MQNVAIFRPGSEMKCSRAASGQRPRHYGENGSGQGEVGGGGGEGGGGGGGGGGERGQD